jgi:hypothetical protein
MTEDTIDNPGISINRRFLQINLDGSILFFDRHDAEIGRLAFVDGAFHFDGKADESAEVFFSAIVRIANRGWWRKAP